MKFHESINHDQVRLCLNYFWQPINEKYQILIYYDLSHQCFTLIWVIIPLLDLYLSAAYYIITYSIKVYIQE